MNLGTLTSTVEGLTTQINSLSDNLGLTEGEDSLQQQLDTLETQISSMINEGGGSGGQGSGGAYGIIENKSFIFTEPYWPGYNEAWYLMTGQMCFESFTAGANQPIEFYANFSTAIKDTEIEWGHDIDMKLYRDGKIVART